MDQNRQLYDKRHVQKPIAYFTAKRDEFGNTFNSDNGLPDYHIIKERDIDDEGIFME
jgi:hypothetical protein